MSKADTLQSGHLAKSDKNVGPAVFCPNPHKTTSIKRTLKSGHLCKAGRNFCPDVKL